jgi:hypothetical protein
MNNQNCRSINKNEKENPNTINSDYSQTTPKKKEKEKRK